MFPVSMDVISWLGAFHVRNEVYEKAMPFFDLASKIQPQVGADLRSMWAWEGKFCSTCGCDGCRQGR